MKLHILLALTLVCAIAACTPATTQEDPTQLPQKRPADFRISFHEWGGPDDPVADYSVSAKEAFYKTKEGDQENTWAFSPDTTALDSLYTLILKDQITGITAAEEKGGNPDRFGYKLEITYNGQQFSVMDHGTSYIQQEAEYNRFMDAIAEVRAFVGQGISDQMIPVAVELVIDPKAPKPDSLSVDLEATNLIENSASIQPGDTLLAETKPLKGVYQLHATAKIDGKNFTWTKSINLVDGPSHTMLLLGKNGFKEAH
jgi:hypothetical protein